MGAYGAWDVYINNHKMNDIKIYPDRESLARAAAEHIVESGTTAIQNQDRFSLALAGGSTPKAAFELLASDEYAQRLDWKRVHIFWGDERCVPADDPESNYRLAREAFLDSLPIPDRQIFRARGELEPQQLGPFMDHAHSDEIIAVQSGLAGVECPYAHRRHPSFRQPRRRDPRDRPREPR